MSFNEKKFKIIGRLSLAAIGVLGFALYFRGSILEYFMIFASITAVVDLFMTLQRPQ
jgi:hypothetical protein